MPNDCKNTKISNFILYSCIVFSDDGKPHGSGYIVYYTNDKHGRYNYSGTWQNGRRHGQGLNYKIQPSFQLDCNS